MATPDNQKKRRSRMPGATAECRPSSAEETLEFILSYAPKAITRF
jgi:hypothetical protein